MLGGFLLASAGLKVHSLVIGLPSQASFLFSPRLLIATIELETVLGLWLLSGLSARVVRFAALGFFGVLAGVSLFLALDGQPSCGCFGRVEVNPWITFALDVMAMGLLVFFRPNRVTQIEARAWLPGLLKTGVGTGAILAMTGGPFLVEFGNPSKALLWLRGESITVEPTVNQIGEGIPGEERTLQIQLTNNAERPICIFGGTTTCSCVVTGDLPITVEPGESRSIQVQVKFRGRPGRFQRWFVLYTDDEKQPEVAGRFEGRVVEAPSP